MGRWVVTERELSGNFLGEGEIGTRERLSRTDVIRRAIKADRSHGTHDSPGRRLWGACAAIRFPHAALPPPVRDSKMAHRGSWACVGQHSEGRIQDIPNDSRSVIFEYLRYSHGTRTRPSDRALMAKSRSGS